MPNQNSPKAPRWTILDVLRWTTEYFKSHDIDSPRLTAEIFLAETLQVGRIDLYLRFEQPLSETERDRVRELVRRRIRREPVAYILGKKEFWGIEFDVTPDVLIPRPDTEFLVQAALDRLPEKADRPVRVIDLGTGSGAIIVSIAATQPEHLYFGTDASLPALHIAAHNAEKAGVADRIRFFAGQWLTPMKAAPFFDMILSNPPYIPTGDIPELAPEIHSYEPLAALDGGTDGLRDIARLITEAPACLVPGGFLMLEIGYDQKDAVVRLAQQHPEFEDVQFIRDYGGHDRVAVLRKPL